MQSEHQDRLIEEALHWLVVLRDRDATAADRTAFEHWRSHSDAHDAAWRRAQLVWSRADALRPAIERQRRSVSRPRVVMRIAAGLLVAAVISAFAWMNPGLFADYRTASNERRMVTLTDGSIVELASSSSMSVDYTDTTRAIRLIEGQAFFRVAADTARPFIVTAAQGQSSAVGTAFDIKRMREKVTVSVIEHAVNVAADAPSLRVEEGQQISYDARGIGQIATVDINEVQGWRRDRLIFHDAPLRDVVADLDRYHRGRIVIADDALGSIPVTAVFDTRQIDAAIQTIAATLPVRVVNPAGLFVLILPNR